MGKSVGEQMGEEQLARQTDGPSSKWRAGLGCTGATGAMARTFPGLRVTPLGLQPMCTTWVNAPFPL
jgi:hypothetical protein